MITDSEKDLFKSHLTILYFIQSQTPNKTLIHTTYVRLNRSYT